MNLNNAIGKRYCLAMAVAAFLGAPLTQAADVNISGFLSVGGGMVDDETVVGYGGYDEEDLTFEKISSACKSVVRLMKKFLLLPN